MYDLDCFLNLVFNKIKSFNKNKFYFTENFVLFRNEEQKCKTKIPVKSRQFFTILAGAGIPANNRILAGAGIEPGSRSNTTVDTLRALYTLSQIRQSVS